MKKIITLLFASAMLTSTFAQYDTDNNWDKNNKDDGYAKGGKHKQDDDYRYRGSYYFTPRERDMEITRINREYDYKIQSVKNKFFMSWYQKKRQIEFLKEQRDREMHRVYAKFNDRRNKYHKHDRWDKKDW